MRVCQTGISSAVAADKCGLDAALKDSDGNRFCPCGIRRAGFRFPSLERSCVLRKEPARPLAEPGEDLSWAEDAAPPFNCWRDECGQVVDSGSLQVGSEGARPTKGATSRAKGGSHFLSDCFFTHSEDAGRCCERKLSEKSEYWGWSRLL